MPKQSSSALSKLYLKLNRGFLPTLTSLLSAGVWVEINVGCSIRDLLCDQLGLESTYLDSIIQTLFLDGKPVDDVDSAGVKNGSTLALSAAMPGLVGATMRKGGHYASFRHNISYENKRGIVVDDDRVGRIKLKLFNNMIKELGPHFLRRGVILPSSEILNLIMEGQEVSSGIEEVAIDESKISAEELLSYLNQNAEWETQIIFD
jgi:hypothetical protein